MELEKSLLESMSKEELETQLADKIKQFHGLLTKEVALKLVAKDKGLLKETKKPKKINKLKPGDRMITLHAQIRMIWPTMTYRSGKRSKVVELEDETGRIPLVLWNDDVKPAELFRSRDKVTLEGAYVKGNELFMGYSGKLDVVDPASFTSLESLEDGRHLHFRGVISGVEGYSHIPDRKVFSFNITDTQTEIKCTIWDIPERGENIKTGDEVILENTSVRDKNIFIGKDGRILLRRSSNMLLGTLQTMDLLNKKLTVKVGEKTVNLDRENALRFMDVSPADDIALSTIVTLKKERMLNTNIAVKIQKTNNGITIQR